MTVSFDFAPIAIFAYNRPTHTTRLIEALKENPEFAQSTVTIYCDGPKKPEHADSVEATRRVVREAAPAHAKIIERDNNFGLAKSIITGVSENVEEHGRVIIMEDDLVPTSGALGFLNAGLERYVNEDMVMHVSAYMFPVSGALPQSFFYREATCWGWGTWKRAWDHFEPDAGKLLKMVDERDMRYEFDVDDTMFFYEMLKRQRDGSLDSWAIRWYTSMFLRSGLALHPGRSYIENLGFDGSGIHCNVDDRFIVSPTTEPVTKWPSDIEESPEAVALMQQYRKAVKSRRRQAYNRVIGKLRALNPFR